MTATLRRSPPAGDQPPRARAERHRLTVVGGLAAMASVAYGPEAIVLVLALAGGAGLGFTLPVTLSIAALLGVLARSSCHGHLSRLRDNNLPHLFALRADQSVHRYGIAFLTATSAILLIVADGQMKSPCTSATPRTTVAPLCSSPPGTTGAPASRWSGCTTAALACLAHEHHDPQLQSP